MHVSKFLLLRTADDDSRTEDAQANGDVEMTSSNDQADPTAEATQQQEHEQQQEAEQQQQQRMDDDDETAPAPTADDVTAATSDVTIDDDAGTSGADGAKADAGDEGAADKESEEADSDKPRLREIPVCIDIFVLFFVL